MVIISISLNDTILEEMERMQKELGYSGRSEIIRSGLRMLVSAEKEKSSFKGTIEGIIIVVNEEKYNEEISKIRHNFSGIIKTQIHNHLQSHKCLQIFIMKGNAKKIVDMLNKIEISKKANYIKFIVT